MPILKKIAGKDVQIRKNQIVDIDNDFKTLWTGTKNDTGEITLNENNQNFKFLAIRGSRNDFSSQGSTTIMPSQKITGAASADSKIYIENRRGMAISVCLTFLGS